jgi:hypothetical protein
MLHHPVEIHQLAVDVVDNLAGGRYRPEEIEGRSTTEHFDIAVVGREKREEAVGKTTLATQPGDDG